VVNATGGQGMPMRSTSQGKRWYGILRQLHWDADSLR
jgi:hypothetical protein